MARNRDTAIYDSIYNAIVEHRIAPGTKLPEDSLAEAFDVSRTLIRKATARLAHEGLLAVAPNRGARVAYPSVREARDVFQARQLVECGAIPQIIARLSAEQLVALRRVVAEERRLERDPRARIRLSGEFHVTLMAVTANAPLIEFLRQLVARSSLIVAVFGHSRGNSGSCQDHSALLDTLEAGKIEDSRDWMEEHLRAVECTLDFNEQPADTPDLKKLFAPQRRAVTG